MGGIQAKAAFLPPLKPTLEGPYPLCLSYDGGFAWTGVWEPEERQ